MTPAEILAAAQAKIRSPDHWTGEVLARRPDGKAVGPSSEIAVAWCAIGALRAVFPNFDYPEYGIAENQLDLAAQVIAGSADIDIFKFNDQGDHTRVMQAFDLAQQACEVLAATTATPNNAAAEAIA